MVPGVTSSQLLSAAQTHVVLAWLENKEKHIKSQFALFPVFTGELAHVQTTGSPPLLSMIHVSLLLGDGLQLPLKTVFAPVGETRARRRISDVVLIGAPKCSQKCSYGLKDLFLFMSKTVINN